MKRSATEQDVEEMIEHVESLGLKANVIRGSERTVIAAVGEERVAGISSLE
ncbi:MAG: 3-deoxy-7-phosphoheptulonate synthase, partial [Planctomycetota bacterium]